MKLFLVLLLMPLISLSKDSVLVSVYPFYDLVKEIAGGRFEVEVLIPPKADYHLYELSSREVRKISQARLVFLSGIPLGGWERKVESIAGKKAVRLAEGVKLKKYTEHEEVRFDPHIWLSPKRMLVVAENVHKALLRTDPEGKNIYEENLKRTLKRLKEMESKYGKTLKDCKHRVMPIVHPALSYLAEDYGLKQLSIGSGDVHGGISPRELSRFVSKLRNEGIDFIFEIYGVKSKHTEVLSREYNLKILREALECM